MSVLQSIASKADGPTHYPYPMSRFGLNPYGQPLWRIVFADSVRRLIGGKWPDGAEEYRLSKVYTGPHAKGRWVLESWISAEEMTGCSPEEYAIRFQAPGCTAPIQSEPYPYQGDYVERHIFTLGEPGNIDELIAKWNRERGVGFAARRRLRQEVIDYENQKTRERNVDMLVDAQPNPCGSMMIKKRRQINLTPAKAFKALPGAGFRQMNEAV
jgi:hypothetical protein